MIVAREALAAAYCVQLNRGTQMVDHELDELKREFLAEAKEKVREMQTALTSGHNPASLERLGYLAHQLKGSGGSYGYQRISADAAEIEKAVESVDDSGLDSTAEKKIQEHVGNLQTEIETRVRELSV
jgi:HPt (histidine-containing phosphotransfer) domain-containing protein